MNFLVDEGIWVASVVFLSTEALGIYMVACLVWATIAIKMIILFGEVVSWFRLFFPFSATDYSFNIIGWVSKIEINVFINNFLLTNDRR